MNKSLVILISMTLLLGCKGTKTYKIKKNPSESITGILKLYQEGLFYMSTEYGLATDYSFGTFEKEGNIIKLIPARYNKVYHSSMRLPMQDSIKFVINSNYMDTIPLSFFTEGGKELLYGSFTCGEFYSYLIPEVSYIKVNLLAESYRCDLEFSKNSINFIFLDHYNHYSSFRSDTIQLIRKSNRKLIQKNSENVWISSVH